MTTPTYCYSPATGGFYLEGLHASIPDDAISISEAEWNTLVDGLAQGANIISTDTGALALQTPEPDVPGPMPGGPTLPV